MPAGKSQGVLGSLIWESHLHKPLPQSRGNSIPTLAFMIYLAVDIRTLYPTLLEKEPRQSWLDKSLPGSDETSLWSASTGRQEE